MLLRDTTHRWWIQCLVLGSFRLLIRRSIDTWLVRSNILFLGLHQEDRSLVVWWPGSVGLWSVGRSTPVCKLDLCYGSTWTVLLSIYVSRLLLWAVTCLLTFAFWWLTTNKVVETWWTSSTFVPSSEWIWAVLWLLDKVELKALRSLSYAYL
jgi:hypothetical protein